MATITHSNVVDGIIDPNPAIGQDLMVQGNNGTLVNCGRLLSFASEDVVRGEPGYRVLVRMVRVTTSAFPEGIWVHTEEGLWEARPGA